jgi:hypothetical protein
LRALTRIAILAALAALLGIAASAASANPTQISIVQDEQRLVHDGPIVQAATLDEIRRLGGDVAKVTVDWRRIAPGGVRKPAGFVGDDPGQYAAENWVPYDNLVRAAQARGLRVMFLIGGHAPDWASGKGRSGTVRPDPTEFGRFAKAVGTRYSGSYVAPPAPPDNTAPPTPCQFDVQKGDQCPQPIAQSAAVRVPAIAADDALPRVSIWSVWNEPNLSGWLSPQYAKRNLPESPELYRGLYLAAHDGMVASGHGGDQILIGELLPFARSGKTYPARVSPLQFLRELACVDVHYRAYTGNAAAARGCTNYRPLPGTGIAYHPYTLETGPETLTPLADDATINDLTRIDRALNKLSKRFVVHRMPIWLTEFGFQTDPPDPFTASIKQVPRFMGESEWLAYHDARVKSYAQYPLSDDTVAGHGLARFHGFQSGIDTSLGAPKPGVYQAYQTPLFVRLVSRSQVEVFGGVRAALPGATAIIQSARGSKFVTLHGGTVALNAGGYFDKLFRLSNAAKRRFRFVSGFATSDVIRPLSRPAAGALYPLKKR